MGVRRICDCEEHMSLRLGFLYLSCMKHAHLSRATNRIECEIGCVV